MTTALPLYQAWKRAFFFKHMETFFFKTHINIFNLPNNPMSRYCYYPHYTDEENETQRKCVT